MVKLTQIEDENVAQFSETANESIPKNEEYLSSSEEEESDDEFDEEETLMDRLVALKDIIPPQQRASLASINEIVSSKAATFFSKTGNLLWAVTSTALLLGVPLSLSILSEQQMIEMEKEMTLQQSSQEVLAPGSDSAFQQPKPSAA